MLTLRVARSTTFPDDTHERGYLTPRIGIYDFKRNGRFESRFSLMCIAIEDDIQTAEGSGATALKEIRRIEAGEVDLIEADGNAWIAHITRDKVWFEGLYSQGEGGEVTFAQYKLAVETYVRFLADPERKPIEVDFPA